MKILNKYYVEFKLIQHKNCTIQWDPGNDTIESGRTTKITRRTRYSWIVQLDIDKTALVDINAGTINFI